MKKVMIVCRERTVSAFLIWKFVLGVCLIAVSLPFVIVFAWTNEGIYSLSLLSVLAGVYFLYGSDYGIQPDDLFDESVAFYINKNGKGWKKRADGLYEGMPIRCNDCGNRGMYIYDSKKKAFVGIEWERECLCG